MNRFTSAVASLGVSLATAGILPAQEQNLPSANSRIDQQAVTGLLGQVLVDNPNSKDFYEPDAIPDLYKIRHQAGTISVGEKSPVISLLQVRSQYLPLTGSFDSQTEKIIQATLSLINKNIEKDLALELPVKIDLRSLAHLVRQERLLQTVARADFALSQVQEPVAYVATDSLAKGTIRAIDQIIIDTAKVERLTGQVGGSDALRAELVELRDTGKAINPGEKAELVGYLKSILGIEPVTTEYTDDLKKLVLAIQKHSNSIARPARANDGIIDPQALLRILDYAKPNSSGTNGVTMIDIFKSLAK